MGKKDQSVTFRVDDSLKELMLTMCRTLKCDESALIRASILIAAPILKEYPLLLGMISILPSRST